MSSLSDGFGAIKDSMNQYLDGAKEKAQSKIDSNRKTVENMAESQKKLKQNQMDAFFDNVTSGLPQLQFEAVVGAIAVASSAIEGVTALFALAGSYGTLFWLSIVQVLVSELDSSLTRQQGYLRQIVGQIDELNARVSDVLDALDKNLTNENLVAALKLTGEAQEYFQLAVEDTEIGGQTLKVYIGAGTAKLQEAYSLLKQEIDKATTIPSLDSLVALYTFLGNFIILLPSLYADFLIEWGVGKTLKTAIIFFRKKILETKDALDLELVATWLNDEIDTIGEKIQIPLGEKLKEWEDKKNANAAKILWQDTTYWFKIKKEHDRINAYFDPGLWGRLELNDFSEDYVALVDALKNDLFWEPAYRDEVAADVAKTTAPIANIFDMGESARTILDEFVRKSKAGFNGHIEKINQTKRILADFGPYEHAFLSVFNNVLSAFGVNNPIQTFASGNLLAGLGVSGGVSSFATGALPSVPAIGNATSTVGIEIGLAITAATGVTASSGLVDRALGRFRKIDVNEEKDQARRDALKVQNTENESMAYDTKVADDLERETEVASAMAEGKIPPSVQDALIALGEEV